MIFLDDGLGSAANELVAKIYSLQVNTDLARLGFVVNEEKSQWTPVRIIIWLGIVLNTINGTISVTDKRISKLKISLDSICESESGVVKVKELARAVGQIISLSPVVGNLSRIMTQSMYTVIKEVSWYSLVKLSGEAVEENKFWQHNVESVNEGIQTYQICTF